MFLHFSPKLKIMSAIPGLRYHFPTTYFHHSTRTAATGKAKEAGESKQGRQLHLPPMSPTTSPSFPILLVFLIQIPILAIQCYQYKVGDLDSWGLPASSSPLLYSSWSKYHHFRIGDSLMFLYPPSQDSVFQVSETAFQDCVTSDPILKMTDGNSVFNLTEEGNFYFTSGAPGHCEKHQKLAVSVGNGSEVLAPAASPAADSPSFPIVFGSMPPTPPTSSSVTISFRSGLDVLLIAVAVAAAAFWI